MKTFHITEEFVIDDDGMLAHIEIRGDDRSSRFVVVSDVGEELFEFMMSPGEAMSMGFAITRSGQDAQIAGEHRTPARHAASHVTAAPQPAIDQQPQGIRAVPGGGPAWPGGTQAWPGGAHDDTAGSPQ